MRYYKGIISALDNDIAFLTNALLKKKVARETYIMKLQKECSHEKIVLIKEEYDERAHSECAICGIRNHR